MGIHNVPDDSPPSSKSFEGVSMKSHNSTTLGASAPRIHPPSESSSMEDFCVRIVFLKESQASRGTVDERGSGVTG
jgi:hypothetical protein